MYHHVVSKIYDIYQFPIKIFSALRGSLSSTKTNHSRTTVTHRLIRKNIKNNQLCLKFQIINSRATYSVYLSDIISDSFFISSCEKSSLIEIGYFSKVEEYKRIQQLEFNIPNNNTRLRSILFKYKNTPQSNVINPDEFHYQFSNIEGQSDINLLIPSTNHFFKIPFNELLIDSGILDNIYPPDLLKIGYELCNIEIRQKKKPTYYF